MPLTAKARSGVKEFFDLERERLAQQAFRQEYWQNLQQYSPTQQQDTTLSDMERDVDRKLYDTPIPPEKQEEFKRWIADQSVVQGRDISRDIEDYDIKGFFLAGETVDDRGHGTDRFKKPNHPTFSEESIYHGNGNQGGKWLKIQGKDIFVPGKTNKENWSKEKLQDYFSEYEPNVILDYDGKVQDEKDRAIVSGLFGEEPAKEPGKKPAKGQEITFMGEMAETPWKKLLPFVGSAVEAKELWDVYNAAQSLESGEATKEELQMLKIFMDKMERDRTWGAQVAGVLTMLPGFMGELLLTSGFYSAGRVATTKVVKEGAEYAVKKLLTKGGRKTIERALEKRTVTKGAELVTKIVAGIGGGTLQTIPAGATRIPGRTIRELLPEFQVSEDEAGALEGFITGEGEDVFKAFQIALGDQWVEVVSEHSGGLLNQLSGPAKSAAVKMGIVKAWKKTNPGSNLKKLKNIIKRTGWNGYIAEIFEERIGEFGRAAIGLEEYRLPTPEQISVELVAFAIPGVTIAAGENVAGRMVGTEKKEKAKAEMEALGRREEQELIEKIRKIRKEKMEEAVTGEPAPAEEPAPEVTEDQIIKALTAQGFPSEEIVRMSAAERHEAYDKKKKYEAPKEEKVARPVKPKEAAEEEKAVSALAVEEARKAEEKAPLTEAEKKFAKAMEEEERLEAEEELTAEKRAIVTTHVEEQKSYEDVVDLYPDDTEVGRFARERGREKFGIKAKPKKKAAPEEDLLTALVKYPVKAVPVKDIKIDPKDFQFKKDVDERGIQKGTEIKGEFAELTAGNILVWQAKDGTMFVVNGHHRLAKAKEEGVTHINAQIIKETDGFSRGDALNLGAVTNIQEGRGTPYDWFEFFKGSEISETEVKKRGIEKQVYTLAQVAGDDLTASFRNRVITPEQAYAIAEAAGKDEAMQAVGMKLLQIAKEKGKKLSPEELTNQIKANIFMKEHGAELKSVQQDLFGENYDAALAMSEKLAKLAGKKQAELKEIIGALRNVKKENRLEIMKKTGLKFESVAEALEVLKKAKADLAKWKHWETDPDLRQVILDELEPTLDLDIEKEEDVQFVDGMIEMLNDELFDFEVKITNEDVEIVEPSGSVQKAASALAGIFGQRAIFIKVKEGASTAITNINGFAIRKNVFVDGTIKGTTRVILNVDSRNNHFSVAGHELVHQLKAEAPDLYAELDRILKPQVEALEHYHKTSTYPSEKIHEELYGDRVGERMLDEEFWNKMASENTSLVQKISKIFKKIIATIDRSKYRYSVGVFFKDLHKVDQTIDRVMKKYQARIKLRERAVKAAEKDIELSFDKDVDKLMQSKARTEPLFNANMDAIDYILDQYHADFDEEYQAANSEAAVLQDELKATLGTKTWGKAETELEEAIQVYIDVKNAEFETGETPEEQFEKWEETIKDENKKVFEASQNLTEDQIALADKIIRLNRQSGERARADAIIGSVVHDYTMRLWKTEKGEQDLATIYGKFRLKTARAKHRTFESILEGWSKGKELRIKGAITARQMMSQQISMVRWQRELMNQAKSLGLVSTKAQGEDWVLLEHPNMKEWKWVKKLSEEEMEKRKADVIYDRDLFITEDGNIFKRSDMYAEPEFGHIINKIFGKSSLLTGPGAFKDFMRATTRLNAELKHTVLTTSFFHHQAFLRSYWFGGRDNIFKALNPLATVNAVRAGQKAIKNFTPEVRELSRAGLTIGRIQDFDEKLGQERTRIGEICDKIGGLKQTKAALLRFRDWQTHILFNVMGPGLKVQAALLEYRHQLKKQEEALRSGEITKHEIAKKVAGLLNDDFGGLHLQRMRRDPTAQHIFRLLALAPDWTESNIRTMHKLFTEDVTGRKIYRGFWYGIVTKAMTMTVLFNILMSAFDDEDFFERYRKAWEAGNLRWLDADITPIWKAVTGGDPENPDKRMYFSILGHFRDPIKFIATTGKAAKHKGSIVSRIAFDYFTGEDWAGRRFTTWQELIGIDDKGRYKTTRRGKYVKGQKKGGKLKGKVVTWTEGPEGHTSWAQMPSFLISTLRGSALPIWGQNLIGFLVGEMDGFFAAGKGAGFMISQSYPKKDKSTARARLKARAARARAKE